MLAYKPDLIDNFDNIKTWYNRLYSDIKQAVDEEKKLPITIQYIDGIPEDYETSDMFPEAQKVRFSMLPTLYWGVDGKMNAEE